MGRGGLYSSIYDARIFLQGYRFDPRYDGILLRFPFADKIFTIGISSLDGYPMKGVGEAWLVWRISFGID